MTTASRSEMYHALLTDVRRRKSSGPKDRSLAMQASSDLGRVMFSTGFRRLQSKTQVFPQEWNAAVRTRLTHSLEVASIGRYLAENISERLLDQGLFGDKTDVNSHQRGNAFTTFVEVACLMHDLGNPPFGHFGEASIQDWFKTRQQQYRKQFPDPLGGEFDELYKDFSMFDGNPQGFRMATRLQWVNDEFGYNLTYTQLAATLKYPWTPEKIGSKKNSATIKKAGVFYSEVDILAEIQENLNIQPFARHPLAYIMEVADDISYCLSDIEDALEKGVVRDMDVINAFRRGLAELKGNRYAKKILAALPDEEVEDSAWYVKFRTTTTNVLVERGCELYLAHHDAILNGDYFSLLRKSKAAKALLGVIEEFSKQYLYSSKVVRERELVGYQVTQGILDRFGLLLDLPSKEAEALLIEKKELNMPGMTLAATLQSFLPRKHIKVYQHALGEIRARKDLTKTKVDMLEWMARAHLIVDFLSGMTDDFSIVTYRRLYDGGSSRI